MAAENFKVKKGLEVGTGITANSDGVNVTGIVTATQFKGDGSGLTGVVGSGSGVVVKDEGSAVGTAGTINFVGSGVAAAITGGTATVTINSGGLSDVVGDTTPQLGGNLDLNSKFITGTGNIDITGSLDVSGIATVGTLKGAIEATTASFSGAIDANGDLDVDGQTELDDLNVSGIATGTIFKVPDATNVSGATNHIAVGDNSDLKLYHDNNGDAQIFNSTGHLTIVNNTSGRVINLQPKSGANGVIARYEGAAELYHNGNLKLTTTINGIEVPDLNVTGVGTVGRLETNGVTLGTNNNTFAAKFIDDAVANFGTGNDLKIYHQNSDNNSYIKNTNGNLFFYATNTTVGLKLEPNAKVRIYHAGNAKLETDQAGVKITGVCTATSFSGSGSGLTSIPSAQLSGALPALDGSALTGITASGSGIIVKHDGSTVGTAGTINFSTNLDVSAISAGIVTVTASGGGVSLANGVDNRVVTATGAAALNGEANLTWDGTTLAVTGNQTVSQSVVVGSAVTVNSRGINIVGAAITAYDITADNNLTTKSGSLVGSSKLMISGGSGLDMNYYAGGTAYSQHIFRLMQGGSTIEKFRVSQHGVNVGGIATATTFSGSGASLTTLNASELDSGTIPNGRFPTTLPATSGVNLTALNASEITSGTLPIARIADDAVTFAKMQNVGTGVFIGRNDSGTGDIETLTAAEARTLLNVADGATAGITTAPSNVVLTWDVVNQSASAYRFTGPGQDPTANNPDIYLVRGNKYRFALNAGGHPFQIRVSNGGSAYNDGVTNNGAQTGNVEFYVQNDAPASLVYQCTAHSGMVGNIYITGHQLTNGANNRVVTATSAYGMNGEANLTFDGTQLVVQGGSGTQHMFRHSAGWGGVTSAGSAGGSGAGFSLANNYSGTLETKWSIYLDGSNDGLRFTANTPDQTSDERLRITSDGKVGIGTDNPNKELEIHGGSDTCLRVVSTAGGVASLQLGDTSDHIKGAITFKNDDNTLRIRGHNNADRIIIASDGDLTLQQSATLMSPGATLSIISDKNVETDVDNKENYHLVLANPNNDTGEAIGLAFGITDTTTKVGAAIVHERDAAGSQGSLKFFTRHNNAGPPTEKVRIMGTSLPTLKVGGTTASSIYDSSGTGNEGAWLVAAGYSQFATSNDKVCVMNRKSSNGIILEFRYNGSSVGSFSTNSSSLPSDRNFKTNISSLSLGLSFVNKLKPSQFNYKIDEPNTPVMYGLIAQELEESLTSEGVSKNSTQLIQHHPTDDTESDYDVDYTKLTPVLINAVKELSTEIDKLKAEIAALKSS